MSGSLWSDWRRWRCHDGRVRAQWRQVATSLSQPRVDVEIRGMVHGGQSEVRIFQAIIAGGSGAWLVQIILCISSCAMVWRAC